MLDELVGRDGELAELTAALDAGRAGVVLLLGEPGIGKSRLADELALRARAAGFRVLRGEADAAVRAPMELWRGLGVRVATDPDLAAAERRWEQLDTLASALAEAAPAVVVLDDIHWADDTAVWVLEHLPRVLGDARVLLVATSRDKEPGMPELDGLRRVARVIRLEGLDVDAVARLAAVDGEAAADLRDRTGGNPLFVRELVHGDDGGVIDDVLGRALERTDEATRSLLAVAAAAGPSAPLAVVAAAAGVSEAEAAERLEVARRDGVISEVAPVGVRFRHALLADAAAAAVADAASVHARLADAWSARAGLDAAAAAVSHRLRADPSSSTVDAALAVAAALVEEGRPAPAAAVLRTAAEATPPGGLARVRATLDLADLLLWLGETGPSMARYGEVSTALDGLGDTADPTLRARTMIGLSIGARPFAADPELVRRLEDALAALPPDELRLRANLLGRLAVFGGADPSDEGRERGRAWGDAAVAFARETGDPLLVVQSLLDRHIAPASVEELDEQVAAGEEIAAMAERAGRGDLAVQGHQWRAIDRFNRGDLVGAGRALGRAELLAELQPSPMWRYSTMVRRVPLVALTGDRAGAAALMTEAVRVGTGAVDDLGIHGFHIDHRTLLVDLFGGPDPDADALFHALDAQVGDLPVPFLQVSLCHVAAVLGHLDRAAVLLRRVAGEPERVVRSLGGDSLLRKLGDVTARLGAADVAGPVYAALQPFAGRMNVGNGSTCGAPVDLVLAELARLRGDEGAALDHAKAALALVEAMPAPPLVARCLEVLGEAPPVATPATKASEAELARDGKVWVLTSPLGSARLPDSTGLAQLARLLGRPGVEVAAVDLTGPPEAPVANDLGPALDAQAKRAYRARLAELQRDLDRADATGNAERSRRAQAEIDALLQELERAVGLGGRDRPTGSGAERARINVVRSLKRAVVAIAEQAPDLGRHLEVSLRTGRACAYDPEPAAALRWNVVQRG